MGTAPREICCGIELRSIPHQISKAGVRHRRRSDGLAQAEPSSDIRVSGVVELRLDGMPRFESCLELLGPAGPRGVVRFEEDLVDVELEPAVVPRLRPRL